MRDFLRKTLVALGFVATAGIIGAAADVVITVGSGTTIFAFTCFTTKVCPAAVTVNSAGTEIMTSGAPARIDPTGTTPQPVTQFGTWNIATITALTGITNPLPAGTNVIGHIICDSGCSGSGGTSSNFGSAFPSVGTAIGLTNGTNMVAWSATSNYGTSPGAIAVPSVNAFVTNTTALGQAAAGSSSPVVGATGTIGGGSTGTAGTAATTVVTIQGIAAATPVITGANPYPVGATAITASATGTTGATTATLAGTSGKTTYICGYSIRANATANTNVTNTITGVITATLSSIMWVPANTVGLGVDEQIFSPCIPASATNTGIAIVSGAPGTGGLVSSKGWGYQL